MVGCAQQAKASAVIRTRGYLASLPKPAELPSGWLLGPVGGDRHVKWRARTYIYIYVRRKTISVVPAIPWLIVHKVSAKTRDGIGAPGIVDGT